MHLGSSPNVGHYYAYGRDASASSNVDWMSFDDSFTSRMGYRHVQRMVQSISADSPYILFYYRRDEAMPQDGFERKISDALPEEKVENMEEDTTKTEEEDRVSEKERDDDQGAYEEWWNVERRSKETLSRLPQWLQREIEKERAQNLLSFSRTTVSNKKEEGDDDGNGGGNPHTRHQIIRSLFPSSSLSDQSSGWRHDRGGGGGAVF